MPARSDIDPADIPALLPYISIVHKVDGEFRFRLVGSAIARQFGRELTGSIVGSGVSNADESMVALAEIGERVFAAAHPVFGTGRHKTGHGIYHEVSTLLLPLSDDGTRANMIIFTRIACFSHHEEAGSDWLGHAPFELREAVDVDDEADLVRLCLDWERLCLASNAAARPLDERTRNTIVTR